MHGADLHLDAAALFKGGCCLLMICCFALVFPHRLNVEDEVFADPEALDFDLLSGMDLPQAPASTNDRSRDQSTSQQHKQAASGDTTEPESASAAAAAATAAAAVGRAGATAGVPYEFDDQMFVMEDQTQEVQHRADQEEEQDRESDQQQSRDQVEPGEACAGQQKQGSMHSALFQQGVIFCAWPWLAKYLWCCVIARLSRGTGAVHVSRTVTNGSGSHQPMVISAPSAHCTGSF
jgi:hypothetical protein